MDGRCLELRESVGVRIYDPDKIPMAIRLRSPTKKEISRYSWAKLKQKFDFRHADVYPMSKIFGKDNTWRNLSVRNHHNKFKSWLVR